MSLRPVAPDDLAALEKIEAAYAGDLGEEQQVNMGALHYFGRSGHSFVALDATGQPQGFVFAHAGWSGGRPSLRVERLAGPAAAVRMLAEAVVKSAYDAGVYRLTVELPGSDGVGRSALESAGFESIDHLVYVRRLGSAARGA